MILFFRFQVIVESEIKRRVFRFSKYHVIQTSESITLEKLKNNHTFSLINYYILYYYVIYIIWNLKIWNF